MGKTCLRLDKELSVIVLSMIAILFTFLADYAPITNLVSFVFVFIKSSIFVVVPLIFYLIEKKEYEFKKIAGIYTSYFIINLVITVVVSVSFVNGVTSKIWQFMFDLVNLCILLSGLCILIEQLLIYGEIKNKVYTNTIMKIVYSIANFVSYPFLMFINKKTNREDN